ncbi:MAG: D-alanine--D-alanine ligase family protein [Bacillota bacterium]
MGKTVVCVVFGGKSGEHEVSLMSATSILRELDRQKFDVVSVGVAKSGKWYWVADPQEVLKLGYVPDGWGPEVVVRPGYGDCGFVLQEGGQLTPVRVDVVFPVLHGTFGEDGTVQGLLEMVGVPYVGAGVIGSAIGMNKVVSKKLFRQEGLPTAEFIVVSRRDLETRPDHVVRMVEEAFGYPCFVKPACLGSSVGVNKALDRGQLVEALGEAALYDSTILVEDAIEDIHEVECSVLGNDAPLASCVGEIVPSDRFYSYRAKYIDGKSQILIPAPIPHKVAETVREYAIRAFKAAGCCGMARVDCFVRKSDYKVFINEINTIPGFTAISMYPKLWEHAGLKYPELLTELIRLAIECFEEKRKNRTSYQFG